ncbi:MAG TPA: DUF6384 family protein [Trueperaceae bacterium]|nr:DUF6384 family protein [Trueperaceae bacterium]
MTPATAPRPAAPLDDVMLAMDVVDTLRQRRQLVEQELAEPGRAKELVARLRDIYTAQGIDVPDAVLAQGVAALAEERFVHRPAPPSTATTLARIYVSRGRWGPLLAVLAAALVVAIGAYRMEVVGPRIALEGDLEAAHGAVVTLAPERAAGEQADAVYTSARAALVRRDFAVARSGLADLQALRATLEQSYTVRIVNRPGSSSGVWRVPDINRSARNYYLIVEALGPDGRPVTVTVRNEETGGTESVREWGVRVDEAAYQAVARDKQDDGIIQNDVVGEKRAGALLPTYAIPTTGAAITRW